MPGLTPAAALYCMQIWTIIFSHTQLQTPTQIELYAVRSALTVRQDSKVKYIYNISFKNSDIIRKNTGSRLYEKYYMNFVSASNSKQMLLVGGVVTVDFSFISHTDYL